MEDFPMWLKLIIWLLAGSTLIYAIGAFLYYNLLG
jgi:hypothetical protein